MAKFPNAAAVEVLRAIEPDIAVVPRGTILARVYFARGPHPTRWDEFRHFGPANARFDHHLEDSRGEAYEQERSVLYCATEAKTCFAEVFQETRRIDRARRSPWLAVFRLERDAALLDLSGNFPTRAGASMAINSGSRVRARAWGRAFYDAYPDLLGVHYPSSMNGNRPCAVLTDRAEALSVLAEHPEFNRPLTDDTLLDVLKHCAQAIGYGLL